MTPHQLNTAISISITQTHKYFQTSYPYVAQTHCLIRLRWHISPNLELWQIEQLFSRWYFNQRCLTESWWHQGHEVLDGDAVYRHFCPQWKTLLRIETTLHGLCVRVCAWNLGYIPALVSVLPCMWGLSASWWMCVSHDWQEREMDGWVCVKDCLLFQLSCGGQVFHFCSHYQIKCTMLLELTGGRKHIIGKGSLFKAAICSSKLRFSYICCHDCSHLQHTIWFDQIYMCNSSYSFIFNENVEDNTAKITYFCEDKH